MPRPATKDELLREAYREYETLEEYLSSLTPSQKIQPGALGDWSVKDVLAHLYEWQQMFFEWYSAGKRGENPVTPRNEYKWSQLPALNRMIYEKYRDRGLAEIEELFHSSHKQTIQLIQDMPEEEMFTPGRYPWCRNNMLVAYFKSNTSSHYHWARTEIRKKMKDGM